MKKNITIFIIYILVGLLIGCASPKTPQQKMDQVENAADNVTTLYQELILEGKPAVTASPSDNQTVANIKDSLNEALESWKEYTDYAMDYLTSGGSISSSESSSDMTSDLPHTDVFGNEMGNLTSIDENGENEAINEPTNAFEKAFQDTYHTGKLTAVTLNYVVDGDTLDVTLEGDEQRLRLLSINCKESVAKSDYLEATNQENTEEGKEASRFTKELLSGVDTLYLEFDTELYDKYNRILAYVWLVPNTLDEGNMLQVQILDIGHAELMVIEPNVKYKNVLDKYVDDGR